MLIVLLCELISIVKGNIALNKNTLLSSVYSDTSGSGPSSLSVDGDTRQAPWSNVCSHTQNEDNPWWSVDLGAMYDVTRIVLYGRTDCCIKRFKNFDVDVIKPNGCTSLCHYQADKTTFLDVTCPPNTVGRYVRVRLRTSNALTICEVQVYGQAYTEPIAVNDIISVNVCLEKGYGYLGSSLSEINWPTKLQCIMLCLSTAECSAAEFNINTKVCKLKRIIDINSFYQEENAFYSDSNRNVYFIN